MKYTPGPWSVVHEMTSTYIRTTSHNPQTDVSVAEVCRTKERGYNARLIAAAPELLEVLKDALEFIRPQYGYDSRLADLLSRADSIIAKAEGV